MVGQERISQIKLHLLKESTSKSQHLIRYQSISHEIGHKKS